MTRPFPNLRSWATTAFAKPILTHRGVRVYHILHREGWPLDYHFSWQQMRADGDHTLPGESFDIRKLPDFFERPGISHMPEGATVRQWRDQHFDDHMEQIMWFIDTCMERGHAPWAGFKRPWLPWRTFACALADDVTQIWRHCFPTPEQRKWRDYDTEPGTAVAITLMTDGTTHFRMVDGRHWRGDLDREYPNSMSAAAMVAAYEKHLRRRFRGKLPDDRPLIMSAHGVTNICIEMTHAEFVRWAESFQEALAMPLNAIVHGQFSSVFRAACDEASMTRTRDFSDYVVCDLGSAS